MSSETQQETQQKNALFISPESILRGSRDADADPRMDSVDGDGSQIVRANRKGRKDRSAYILSGWSGAYQAPEGLYSCIKSRSAGLDMFTMHLSVVHASCEYLGATRGLIKAIGGKRKSIAWIACNCPKNKNVERVVNGGPLGKQCLIIVDHALVAETFNREINSWLEEGKLTVELPD